MRTVFDDVRSVYVVITTVLIPVLVNGFIPCFRALHFTVVSARRRITLITLVKKPSRGPSLTAAHTHTQTLRHAHNTHTHTHTCMHVLTLIYGNTHTHRLFYTVADAREE